MDTITNPYAPGAGTKPPALIGRDPIIQDVNISLTRLKEGRNNQSFILVGLRGVGKTVLLRHLFMLSQKHGHKTIWIEASEKTKLQEVLVPALKTMLEKLSFENNLSEKIKYAFHRLGLFASKFKPSYEGITIEYKDTIAQPVAIEFESELYELLNAISNVAKEKETALTIHIDEMQFLPENHLEALFKTLHLLGQEDKPIMLIGAGLPQIRSKSGKARSYAERLVNFKEIGSLSHEDSIEALSMPAKEQKVEFEIDALEYIAIRTKGYPYFIQQYGSDAWNIAKSSPITYMDAINGAIKSEKQLDESFFKVRFERLTPSERKYLRAMAEFDDEPARSGDIAAILNRDVQKLSPTRNNLIKKGVIYSPAYGDTAFTVPLFDEFLKRVMPTLD
jgi:AAA ATPase domain